MNLGELIKLFPDEILNEITSVRKDIAFDSFELKAVIWEDSYFQEAGISLYEDGTTSLSINSSGSEDETDWNNPEFEVFNGAIDLYVKIRKIWEDYFKNKEEF